MAFKEKFMWWWWVGLPIEGLIKTFSTPTISDMLTVEVSSDYHTVTSRPVPAPSSETFSPWEPTCPLSKVGDRTEMSISEI